MNLLLYKYENKRDFITLLIIFLLISLANILLLSSITNLIITIPQYLLVFYLIGKYKFRDAVLLHFSFMLVSLSSQKTFGMFEGQELSLFNYGTVKLLGPIRASYVVNLMFVLISLTKNIKINRNLLFFKMHKIFIWLAAIGTIIGLMGLLVHPFYTLGNFIFPAIYMYVVISSTYILLSMANKPFFRACYYLSIIALMAGIISSFIAYSVFGVTATYGAYDIIYTSDIVTFGAILIAGFLSIKEKIPLFISLLLFIIISVVVMSGKDIFAMFFSLLCLLYCMLFHQKTKMKYTRLIRFSMPLVSVGILITLSFFIASGSDMVTYKFQSAISMFSNDVSEINRSPYVRVASLLNIFDEGIRNPLALIFGNGFGGYFEDKLNMFAGMDLENGGWAAEVVKVGRFPKGHDTMVSVPLYHGILGLLLIFRIVYLYIKRIPYNFFCGIAFLWILLQFYYNPLYAFMGVFFLMAAEYDINGFNSSVRAS